MIFNRGCGATVGFNTQVSVLSAEAALPDAEGNVLVVDDDVPLALPRLPRQPSSHANAHRDCRNSVSRFSEIPCIRGWLLRDVES